MVTILVASTTLNGTTGPERAASKEKTKKDTREADDQNKLDDLLSRLNGPTLEFGESDKATRLYLVGAQLLKAFPFVREVEKDFFRSLIEADLSAREVEHAIMGLSPPITETIGRKNIVGVLERKLKERSKWPASHWGNRWDRKVIKLKDTMAGGDDK
jgi:hypothetical protein